jgi:hypothetical protein
MRAVSALAHMLETSGTPTVAIGLVRSHMEQMCKPRGLWTPFQLGRPLGNQATRLSNTVPTVPPRATAALALRFLCDDIKAMYSEAAQARRCPTIERANRHVVLVPDDSR